MNAIELIQLSRIIDDAQAYFQALAKVHGGEVTFTFQSNPPYVTAFLGKCPNAAIGFGSSVAGAMLNALTSQE